MKARVASRIGLSVKQTQMVSMMDEDYLWSLGYLDTSNLDQLLNTVVICVGKGFALHAGIEHRAFHAIPFQFEFTFHLR